MVDVSPREHKYRILGVLASYPLTAFLAVLIVVLLNLSGVVAAGVGVVIGLVGAGAGLAVGSEVYARRQRYEDWPL